MGKTMIISSSYRKNSNSLALGLRIGEGAREAGHEVIIADIGRARIEPCRGCGACLRSEGGQCVIKDDMSRYYTDLLAASHLVFCSPIYFFNMGGQLKNFIDRTYAVAIDRQSDSTRFAGKKIAAAFAYGDDDPFGSGCVNALRTMQDLAAYCEATWAGAVYGTADEENEILDNTALLDAARKLGASL